MVNRAFDELVGVLESDSKPVETMSLDVDVSVSILITAGNGRDKCRCDRLAFAARREGECDRFGVVFVRSLLMGLLH
jgi:hypothetical protein